MTTAENSQDQTAQQSPIDYRPRPRYGELAPEGWTWTPPRDERTPEASAVVTPGPAPIGAPSGSVDKPVMATPGWDRPVTLGLLILGLVATYLTIGTLGAVPQSLQLLYTQAGLGTYTPADSVSAIITAASIGQGVIWLATALVSITLIVRIRRAFYVPLIGCVVGFVLLVAAMAVILTGDSALLDYFSRP